MSLIAQKKVILVDLETEAKGTAVVPTTPVLAYDVDIRPAAPFVARKPTGNTLGHSTGQLGETVGVCTFRTELREDAVSGLDDGISVLLQCCGFKLSTLTYAPTSNIADQKTCTIYVYEDGKLKKLTGAMGNVSFDGEFGKVMYCNFEMFGVWIAPTDESMATPTHDATMPPRLASATWTIGSWEPVISTISFNMNNAVVPVEDITAAAAVSHYVITDRDPVVSFNPEQTLVADNDIHGMWLAGTTAALSLALGETITIAAPKLQYREVPEGDRDGRLTDEVTAQCNEDSGDDEITIVTS